MLEIRTNWRNSSETITRHCVTSPESASLSIQLLFEQYLRELYTTGRGSEAGRRWRSVFADLVHFLGHDDAQLITKEDLRCWRDKKLLTLSPKTVADAYLAAVRTVFRWAVDEDLLLDNPAERVRVRKPSKRIARERGFTTSEANSILTAALAYKATGDVKAALREADQTVAAKRWAPWLCAFTGARITEITQLRRADLRRENGVFVLRITPEAGTVKSGLFRDVPVHAQLVQLGFIDFVQAAPHGPLFFRDGQGRNPVTAARMVSARISKWLQKEGLVPEGVAPNHGWRHRFKTIGRELGIPDRTLDALQGHASRTAGDSYGDVTVAARKLAIDRYPSYLAEAEAYAISGKEDSEATIRDGYVPFHTLDPAPDGKFFASGSDRALLECLQAENERLKRLLANAMLEISQLREPQRLPSGG